MCVSNNTHTHTHTHTYTERQTQRTTPSQNGDTFMSHATCSKAMWNITLLAFFITCIVHCISTGVGKMDSHVAHIAEKRNVYRGFGGET